MFLLCNLQLIHHSFACQNFMHAPFIKVFLFKILHYTKSAGSIQLASQLYLFKKLGVKLQNWNETMHVFDQVVLGPFHEGPFMLVTNDLHG